MADPEEQAVADAPEQLVEPEPEQANPLAALVVPDAEPTSPADPEPEPDPEATPEPSTPDVGSFLAENLKDVLAHADVQKEIKQAAADAANEARQAETRRLRLEAGKDELVAQVVDTVMTAYGTTAADLGKPAVGTIQEAFQSLHKRQEYEQAKDLSAALIDQHSIPSAVLNEALEAWHAGNPKQFTRTIAASVFDAGKAAGLAEAGQERTADVARLVQSELDARSKSTTNESPPDAPAGVAAALGPSPQEYYDATSEQRAQWNKDNVGIRIPA